MSTCNQLGVNCYSSGPFRVHLLVKRYAISDLFHQFTAFYRAKRRHYFSITARLQEFYFPKCFQNLSILSLFVNKPRRPNSKKIKIFSSIKEENLIVLPFVYFWFDLLTIMSCEIQVNAIVEGLQEIQAFFGLGAIAGKFFANSLCNLLV